MNGSDAKPAGVAVAHPDRSLRGMLWGVKASFLDYVSRVPDAAMSATGGAVAVDGGFIFPVVDSSDFDRRTGLGTLRFGGDVRFRAHGGMLAVRIAEPVLTAGADGAAVTVLDPAGSRLELAWLGVPEPAEGGGLRIPAVLALAAVPYFNDVYPAGSDLDPIHVRGV